MCVVPLVDLNVFKEKELSVKLRHGSFDGC
jgi:hypothetical protein